METYKLLAILFLVVVLVDCAGTDRPNQCPPWPIGGSRVAENLTLIDKTIPYADISYFWEWMSRLDRLKDQLGACK